MNRYVKVVLCIVFSMLIGVGTQPVMAANTSNISISTINTKLNGVALRKSGAVTINSVDQWFGFFYLTQPQGIYSHIADVNGTATYQVGSFQAKASGTLVLRMEGNVAGRDKEVVIYDQSSKKNLGTAKLSTGTTVITGAVKNHNYRLNVMANYGDDMGIRFLAGVVSSANNRTISYDGVMSASTGKLNYQNFTMSKKGRITLSSFRYTQSLNGPYDVVATIQKKTKSKWKNLATKQKLSINDPEAYGLDKGTYRITTTQSKGTFIGYSMNKKYYSGAYGTTRKKAKNIKRGKKIQNTLLYTSKKGTTHWYKIEVSKSRNVYIDVEKLGISGSVEVSLVGPKNLNTKFGDGGMSVRFYGKAKKGTYYVKISKRTAKSSGSYQVKYTK